MTTLYWYKTGANAAWTTLTGNWWLDHPSLGDGHDMVQASALPANGDEVYLLGATPPTQTPEISLMLFDTTNLSGSMMSSNSTELISIASGGVLNLGRTGVGHWWYGDASAATVITFRGDASNVGTVGDNAIFLDSSATNGIVGNHVQLRDYATVQGGVVGDNATFGDYSSVWGGIIGDNAIFMGHSNINFGAGEGGTLHSLTWDSDGTVNFAGFAGTSYLLGDWQLRRPLKLSYDLVGPGRIIIPRREMDILLGTGGAKIVVGQAYGYGREG